MYCLRPSSISQAAYDCDSRLRQYALSTAYLFAGLNSIRLVSSAYLEGNSLFQQYYAPGRLLGNSIGNPGVNATFDYVVIGAGLAGSVTASRIGEAMPNMTIAVIEAGSFYGISNGNYSQMLVGLLVHEHGLTGLQSVLLYHVRWTGFERLSAVD
jgi:hypothetical protein